MPYEVIMNATGCNGHAVVKVGTTIPVAGGCHDTHQEAIDQMTALNIATSDENEYENEDEERAVSLSAPEFMRRNARRGLKFHEEGLSGDGLQPQTVEDARKMAAGNITEAKWRKISPWIARHMVDLEAEGVAEGEITAGVVAHLLWGSGTTKGAATRTMQYAENIVARLDEEEMRAPAPAKDKIFGSEKNPVGSAADKVGDIELSEATETALQNKVTEHNKEMADRERPVWTRVRIGQLRSVYRRGAGAFSTSHRPNMTRAQWAMARVNAFLFLVRTGKPENPNYVTDNDLLHREHPKYSNSRGYDSTKEGATRTMEHAENVADETGISDDDETEQETSLVDIEVVSIETEDGELVVPSSWVTSVQDNRSIAYNTTELRASDDGRTLVGYASVFDSPSEPLPWIEYVRRGAFRKTIKDGADVRLLIDHEGIPLARTRSGTLMLREDDIGLRVEAHLDDTNPDAMRVISAMRRGDLSQMSFAFQTVKDSWSADRSVRDLKEVRLFDVSVVTYPAYEETVAELRSGINTTSTTVAPTAPLALRKRQIQLMQIQAEN
jgi:uncharacterized protein